MAEDYDTEADYRHVVTPGDDSETLTILGYRERLPEWLWFVLGVLFLAAAALAVVFLIIRADHHHEPLVPLAPAQHELAPVTPANKIAWYPGCDADLTTDGIWDCFLAQIRVWNHDKGELVSLYSWGGPFTNVPARFAVTHEDVVHKDAPRTMYFWVTDPGWKDTDSQEIMRNETIVEVAKIQHWKFRDGPGWWEFELDDSLPDPAAKPADGIQYTAKYRVYYQEAK